MKELEYFMKTEKKMNKYLFCILLSAFLLFSQSSFAKGGGPNTKKEAKIIKKQLKRNQLKGESEYLFDFRGEYFDIVSVSEESKDAFNEVAETYQEKGINVVLIVSKPYLTGLETREELDEKHKAYVLDIGSRLPKNTLAIVLTSELESSIKEIINVYFAVGENVNLEDIPKDKLGNFEVYSTIKANALSIINILDSSGDYFNNETGKYLGKDGNGGKIRLISIYAWDYETDNGTNINPNILQSKTGGARLIDNTVADNIAIEIFSHYYKEAGYNLSELKGGKVSVNTKAVAGTNRKLTDEGLLVISVNKKKLNTILNNKYDIINVIIHERSGHGADLLSGKKYVYDRDFWDWEGRAVYLQIRHWTWAYTSLAFKKHLYNQYGQFTIDLQSQKIYFENYGVELKTRNDKPQTIEDYE